MFYTTFYGAYAPGNRKTRTGCLNPIIFDPESNPVPPGPGIGTPGDQIPVTAPPAVEDINGSKWRFAFTSIIGAVDGPHLFTKSGTQIISVGEDNIKILFVFVPLGGGLPGNGHGVLVDAFNIEAGNFSNDDFVNVSTNGNFNKGKTDTANNDGYVSTEVAEDMKAYPNIVDDKAQFLEWLKIGASISKSSDCRLEEQEDGIAFAFFVKPIRARTDEVIFAFLSLGVKQGAGGVGGLHGGQVVPIGPAYREFTAKLLSNVAILSASSLMNAKLKGEAKNLVSNNLRSIADMVKKMDT